MRLIWIMINVVFWTITLGGTGLVVSLIDWKGRVFGHIARIWSKVILCISGVPYVVKGLENLDINQQYFLAANHESAFDIPLAFASIPFRMVAISKKELRKIPFFGWAMIGAHTIFIDRGNREKAVSSLKKAVDSLRKNPRSIMLYPEGTRSLDGKVHQFKKGGIVLAIETGMPIVPVALCGTSEVVTKGSWKVTPRNIEMRIGTPIETSSLTYEDRNWLAEKLREDVIQMKSEWMSSEK
ncbi:MAG: 1-acyl-sn-glycerol-3-phosphate acyltransferase [Candidatus Marinimicrobia bacterium]|nr:1-acyl-sn-glycerol-3-phosphate acyltransferase [Candidatus Neomarinimicrobiota bacterium]